MEKRKRISLQGYFTRSMLLAVGGAVGIVLFWLLLFSFGMGMGYILPANAGETAARAAMNRMSEQGEFIPPNPEILYDFIYFTKEGEVIESSLSGEELDKEQARYTDREITYSTGTYLLFKDGSYILFSWIYTPQYTAPGLQKVLPPVEIVLLFCLVISLGVFFIWYVHHISKKFKGQLALLNQASYQIASRNLEDTITTSVGIKEFDHTLEAMDHMRQALKTSLESEWKAQQQRKREIAALAHDIKTPLTVINGNAELLIEDSLTTAQKEIARSIFYSGQKAKQYIDMIQQVSNFDTVEEKAEWVKLDILLKELADALRTPALQKDIAIEIECCDLIEICVYPFMLQRALQNIGKNAVEHSPCGTKVKVKVKKKGPMIQFRFEDKGEGFTQEAIAHGTEIFWQQDKSRTSGGNYGLGLSIAAKVAELHKGSILLENGKNGGMVTLTIIEIE